MATTRRAADNESGPSDGVRVLKKYPNRRLYDTQTSAYITLADVKQMVLGGELFEVRDAKTAEDLTRSILLQIILEEESGGVPMLAQIIRFYGHTMQGLMGTYLEKNVQAFFDLQSRFAEQTGGLYEGKAFNPEAWSQFMAMQTPLLQGMMGNYMDQSKNLFVQMQEQMQKQASSFFPTVPGFPQPPSGSR